MPELIPEPCDLDTTQNPSYELAHVFDKVLPPHSLLFDMSIENPAAAWIRLDNRGDLSFERSTSPDGIWPGLDESEWRRAYNRSSAAVDAISNIWQRNRNLSARELTVQTIIFAVLSDEDLCETVLAHIESEILPHFEHIRTNLGLLS